ncbi:MAG: CARDB domain-containing protein [bacterium]|nr:CARDB domain-containing protein [bacterium]
MKFKRNLVKLLSLSIFVLTMAFASNNVGVASEPELTSSQLNYEVGVLLKAKGLKGAAVYQIGSDGKKYIYPDQKTFETWHDDFSNVLEVSSEILDAYNDGGIVTFQPGTKLITHRNTAKVYATGENGQIIHIPDEATARKFYGDNWSSLVLDIDPGVFATGYKTSAGVLSEDNLPEGSLVKEKESGNYFLIENGQKRQVKIQAFGINGLYRKNILQLQKMSNLYNSGDNLDIEEEDLSIFDPAAADDKVLICHRFGLGNKKDAQTIKVSTSALAAHLAHGDSEGACFDDGDDEDNNDDAPYCNNYRVITVGPLRTKHWQELGLDTSDHPEIYQYQIQWFSGYWSPWYTPGLDDIDWKLKNRRVWSYFENHHHQVRICQDDDEEQVLADITISDIIVDPNTPFVNATTTVTVQIENSGSISLTSTQGILNGYQVFEDFETVPVPGALPSTIPDISTSNPLEPGETTFIGWTGKFTSAGEKRLYMVVDNANELEESDETNNTYTKYITVFAEVTVLTVCDHNDDGIRDLADVGIFASLSDTFDVNDDGIHDLSDIGLYVANSQDDVWCESNF